MHVIQKALATVMPGQDDAEAPNGSFELILSAPTLDRDGDTLGSDEWKMPLPDHIVMDIDHGMSVATTAGSGTPFLDDEGRVRVRGTYASTEVGQTTRTLVNEKHIRTASVSFMMDKSLKDGTPRRELLNGAFVAVPSNRESVILSSKAFQAIEADLKAKDDYDGPWADPGYLDSEGKPAKDGNGQPRYKIGDEETARAAWSYINMPKNADQYTADQLKKIKDKIKAACRKFGIEIDDDKKSLDLEVAELKAALAELKAGARNSNADQKYIQAAHDALVLVGADCVTEAAPSEGDGSSEGANKSASKSPVLPPGSSLVVGKGFAGSVEDMQCRVQCALDDACGAGDWGGACPWIIATYMNPDGKGGSVVYRLGGETLCRAFSDDGNCVALDSNIQVVTVVTSVAAVPDTVDGDRVMLPPAAAEASKSATPEPGVSSIPALVDGEPGISATVIPGDGMDLEQFKAALDAIPGITETTITATYPTSVEVDAKSSGHEPGSPATPADTTESASPDSKAASKDPADNESADADDDEAADADTENGDTPADDESQQKRARNLRMRILALNARAEALAS